MTGISEEGKKKIPPKSKTKKVNQTNATKLVTKSPKITNYSIFSYREKTSYFYKYLI